MKSIVQAGIVLFSFLAYSLNGYSQDIYKLKNSSVSFYSHAPLEDIEAFNSESTGIIIFEVKDFNIRVPIKGFQFEKKLMQEHFNENYMESDKFPNGNFKGKIKGDFDLTKNGSYSVSAIGQLDIHGIKQMRDIPVTIKVADGSVSIYSKFKVKLEDHNIEIPSIVFNKIAEVIEVTIKSDLELYKR